MRYYDSVEVYEGIDVNSTSESKEWDIASIGFFQIKGLSFN